MTVTLTVLAAAHVGTCQDMDAAALVIKSMVEAAVAEAAG